MTEPSKVRKASSSIKSLVEMRSPELDKNAAASALLFKFNVGQSGFSSDTLMKILSGAGVATFFPKSTTNITEAKPFNKAGRCRREKNHFERISLPEYIPQAKTEFEEVVYFQHAKLYHFTDGRWKHIKEVRGIGDIQILRQSSTTGKTRFLMWNKRNWNICLNHELTSDLSFQPRGNNGWLWTAQDFSEGKGKTKTFVIRFKYPSNARTFMAAVLKNQHSRTGTDDYEFKSL